ncbi:MAG: protein kinase [Chloroflexota bacterium]
MEELIGRTLGRYRIVKQLGEGGMGAVFKGEDHELKRNVAIKVMKERYANRTDFGELFRQEARATAALDHPNIVKIYDFGQDDDQLYLVMEFISGATLRQLMREMRSENRWLTAGESVTLVRDVTFALDFAHQRGVLHQDIKPGNIMLKQPGGLDELRANSVQPIIMDLGLARFQDTGRQTNIGSSFGGTPAYMSPEQASGQSVDERSDIYSTTVLLYELVLGRVPFAIRSYRDARELHANQSPPVPSTLRPEIDPALEEILLHGLAKNPNQRFFSAAEMGMALQKLPDHIFYFSVPPTATAGTVELQALHGQSLDHTPSPLTPTPYRLASSKPIRYQIVVSGPDRQAFGLAMDKHRLRIGRDESCDLVLDSQQISRLHAIIEFDGAGYHVTDQRSANGVFVGPQRLHKGQSVNWPPGTPLRMGSHLFMLKPVTDGSLPTPPIPVHHNEGTTLQKAPEKPGKPPLWQNGIILLSGILILLLLGGGYMLLQPNSMNGIGSITGLFSTSTATTVPSPTQMRSVGTNSLTQTPTPTESPMPSATSTWTPTKTLAKAPTKTPIPTLTPSATKPLPDTDTPQDTATSISIQTPTPKNTVTLVPTKTGTPTPRVTSTPPRSATDTPSSNTGSSTRDVILLEPQAGAKLSGTNVLFSWQLADRASTRVQSAVESSSEYFLELIIMNGNGEKLGIFGADHKQSMTVNVDSLRSGPYFLVPGRRYAWTIQLVHCKRGMCNKETYKPISEVAQWREFTFGN